MNRLRRWLVAGLPFAVSVTLSLSTVGSHVYWQDSGVFLAGVHDLGVVYPPGYVMYLVLCKAWTGLLFFVDFTLAVHLFSSACSAFAAAVLALAARDFLRSHGRVFGVIDDEPGDFPDWIGAITGCLAACAYTFWLSALYAKGYALFYLILALLIWAMIRADDSGKPRDFTIVAVLIGLSWQAHPSAALAGMVFVAFVCFHRSVVGWGGIAWRSGVAALLALGPIFLVPLFAAREPGLQFADPDSLSSILRYARGSRFTDQSGVWGFAESRWLSVGRYFWEEMLVVGSLLILLGIVRAARMNPRFLTGLALWIIPYVTVTVWFKIEGQHDHWFVAAWLPLYLTAALGLYVVARALRSYGRPAIVALGMAGVWEAVILNGPDLSLRHYDLAEKYGKIFLGNLDGNAILLLNSDDSLAICAYLQRVEGVRPDVLVVAANFLGKRDSGEPSWYDEKIARQNPGLRRPDYGASRVRFPRAAGSQVAISAFVSANVAAGRPLFLEMPLPLEMVPNGFEQRAAGAVWKIVPAVAPPVDPYYWNFPVEPQELQGRRARERSQAMTETPTGLVVHPESYEHRLMKLLLRARGRLAERLEKSGNPDDAIRAAELRASNLKLDPD